MAANSERPGAPSQAVAAQVASGIWCLPLRTPTLPPATETNCWLVDVGDGLAVIDPGSPDPEEQARLAAVLLAFESAGLPPRQIWLTHAHPDHAGGVAALRRGRGLPLLAHPRAAGRLPPEAGSVEPLLDGALLAGRFRALHTPGHACDHLCFLDERTGALLCGDMASTLSTIVIDPPDGDMADYFRQLERLRTLGSRLLLPAHGPPAPDPAAVLERLLAHRREREERVLAALTGPMELAEVTRRAYPEAPEWLLPFAERSCLAHLLKLESEGKARRDQDGRGPDAPAGRWSRP